jgi:hypothetical protein
MFGIRKTLFSIPVCLFLLIFIFSHTSALSQTRKTLTVTAKFKIDGGGSLNDAYMVLQRDGQSVETLPGQSSYTLNLEIGADYILSFNKPGYITKKININTTVNDEERVEQGFESYPFTVVLIKQYEGVNIVVFNQPVAKITYSKKYDEFDYDTDYTKSIQSAIQKAEEDLKKAEKEYKKNPPKPPVDTTLAAVKSKPPEVKATKTEPSKKEENANASQLPDKKQAADSVLATTTQAPESESKKSSEKRKAKGVEGKDNAIKPSSGGGKDELNGQADSGSGKDDKPPIEPKAGKDAIKGRIGVTKGQDQPVESSPKEPVITKEKEVSKHTSEKPVVVASPIVAAVPDNVTITREQISEDRRIIYHVWVTKGDKTVLYSKVVYNWGGVFYFRDMKVSISENLFKQADAGLVKF